MIRRQEFEEVNANKKCKEPSVSSNVKRKRKNWTWCLVTLLFYGPMRIVKNILFKGSGLSGIRNGSTSNYSTLNLFANSRNIVLWILVLLRILCTTTTHAFNLDVKSALVHQGAPQSYFGYSVALHVERNYSWLLVGAPNAQTLQPGVERGGAVLKCSIDKPNACHEVLFDRSGSRTALNNVTGSHDVIENKSHQWFGATLKSSGPNGFVVACAPRYVYFSSNFKKREPIGACYVARKSLTDFQLHSPCKTSEWGYHRQGSCQAGFSATFSEDGRKLYLGAVGSWYWQGQVFLQNLLVRAETLSTNEQPPHYDDSYMGYSMAAGEFSGDRDMDVVVGVPRGNNLTGKIIVYNSSLVPLYEINGEQIASYFGYTIVVGDIDGDKFDDIIVSSPMFSNYTTKDGQYETGRVYVVYQGKKAQKRFSKWAILDGKSSRSRFGASLAYLGDLNKDSYGDFAVGAPYGGDNGGGAVYIYHGSKDGVIKKPSQIIYASDIQENLKTFGYSLSAGLDMDSNEYTDLLVGAYASDKVVFLRSRPIVTVTATLTIEPEKINLDDKRCSLLDNNEVACVVVSTCLEYRGDAVPSKLDFEIETVLDSTMEVEPRLFFLSNERHNQLLVNINVSKGIEFCRKVFVYIKSNVRDKLTPITIEMNYTLKEDKFSSQRIRPILNYSIPSKIKRQVNIQKNCGKDNVCIPQLSIFATTHKSTYIMGSKERLELEVTISNSGEDAFEAIFYLNLPFGVDYVNIDRKDLAPDVLVTCSGPSSNNSLLKCDVGNPLPNHKNISFKVLLLPFNLSSIDGYYLFTMEVNSTNPENETTVKDNVYELKVPVLIEVEILVSGISATDPVFYNKTKKGPTVKTKEEDLGPEIIHLYDVINRGTSDIVEAEVVILWPTYTLENHHLLYLVEEPEVIGSGQCEHLPNINPLNLTIQPRPYVTNAGGITTIIVDKEDDDNNHSNMTQTYIPLPSKKNRRDLENGFQNELSCGPTLCTQIHCQVYNLAQGQHVIFRIRSRLATETLHQYGFDNVTISSKLVTKVTKTPFAVQPDYLDYKVYIVSTLVNPTETGVALIVIPWWIIASAVCTGVLVLGLVIIVLWKVGFFKRTRPHDEFEREPLNKSEKNGILELSDEAL